MADSYSRVSRDGIRSWLDNPVTKAYLACIGAYREQLGDVRASAGFQGQTHDATISNLYRNLGADECVGQIIDPERLLDIYQMVEDEQDAA